MEQIFDKLRSLQDILSQKFEIETEIEDIPKILSTKTELLNRLRRSYIEKNDEYTETQSRIKEIRQRMDEAERGREKYESQMDLIKTQREYETLDKEIKDAGEREQSLRKDLQTQLKRLEEMKINLDREGQLIEKQEEEVAEEQSRLKGEIGERNKALTKLKKEEGKITPGLDEEILFKFERIIRNQSGVGIVPIVDHVCTGCHMVLPAQFVNDVRNGEGIMFCPHCSRILYYENDSEESGMGMWDVSDLGIDSSEGDEDE